MRWYPRSPFPLFLGPSLIIRCIRPWTRLLQGTTRPYKSTSYLSASVSFLPCIFLKAPSVYTHYPYFSSRYTISRVENFGLDITGQLSGTSMSPQSSRACTSPLVLSRFPSLSHTPSRIHLISYPFLGVPYFFYHTFLSFFFVSLLVHISRPFKFLFSYLALESTLSPGTVQKKSPGEKMKKGKRQQLSTPTISILSRDNQLSNSPIPYLYVFTRFTHRLLSR